MSLIPTKLTHPTFLIFRVIVCPDTKNNFCYLPTNEDTDHNQHYQRLWKKYNFAFEMKNNLRKNSTFEQFIIDNLASGKAKKSTAAPFAFTLTTYYYSLSAVDY